VDRAAVHLARQPTVGRHHWASVRVVGADLRAFLPRIPFTAGTGLRKPSPPCLSSREANAGALDSATVAVESTRPGARRPAPRMSAPSDW
jgi:hypothetical protein